MFVIFTFLHEFPYASAHDDLIYTVKYNVTVLPEKTVQLMPSCDRGDIAVSGGWEGETRFFSMGANKANVSDSLTQPSSWLIELRNIDSIQHDVNGTVLCIESLNPDSNIVQKDSGFPTFMAPGQSAIIQADCASGEVAISGGIWNQKHEQTQIFIDAFGPNVSNSFSTPTGWLAGVTNIGNSTAHVQSLVMCMKTQEKNSIVLRVDEKQDFVSDLYLEKKCRDNETIVGGGFFLGSKDVNLQSFVSPETMHEAGWKTRFFNFGSPTNVQSYSMCMKTSELDEHKFDLKLNSGTISLSTPLIQADKIITTNETTDSFFFLQTHHILDSTEQKNLQIRGIDIIDSLNGFVYVASAPTNLLDSFSPAQFPEIRSIFPILPEYKQSSDVANRIIPSWAKFSGSVVPDSDGDGISDYLDSCPTQTETFNGFIDKDGCPDTIPGTDPTVPDSDGDGISDYLDSCPTQTETFNGFIDKDGCPDTSPSGEQAIFTIHFYNQPPDTMRQIVEDNGGTIVSIIENMHAVSALMSFDQISNLVNHSAVRYINYIDPLLEPEIDIAKDTAHISPLNKTPYSLTGKNVVALVYDAADVFSHPDFGTRLTNIVADTTTVQTRNDIDHATHVSGILGGNGPDHKGIAPDVEIISIGVGMQTNTNFLFDNTGDLQNKIKRANEAQNNIDLVNISLGHKVNKEPGSELLPCRQHGNYTNTSIALDNLVREGYPGDLNGLIITKSGGNERDPAKDCSEKYPSYDVNFGTVNSPATAKNPIVVGSINTVGNDNNKKISRFSSFGPTDDGRIKPDLVAPGCHSWTDKDHKDGIFSTISFVPGALKHYSQQCGTSQAAPFVGGLVALMVEQWEYHFPDDPLFPHTTKAILIHTADDLGRIGPDYESGWGMVNGKNAIDLIRDAKLIHNTNNNKPNPDTPIIISDSAYAGNYHKEYKILASSNDALKFTLVWDDPPGHIETAVVSKILINDLNLIVTNPSNTEFKPQLLDPSAPTNDFHLGIDNINNVEMIKSNGDVGYWTIEVSGNVSEGPQNYTIIISEQSQNPPPNQTVNASIVTAPATGGKMSINVTFKTNDGLDATHVTYDIEATQRGTVVLNDTNSHIHTGKKTHTTNPLLTPASSSAPVNVVITFKGFGGVPGEGPLTGEPRVIPIKVVPEFNTIAIMILAIAIISIIVLSAKSRLSIIPRV